MGHAKWKGVFEHVQNTHIQIHPLYAQSHPGICSPLIHSIVSNDSDTQGPDQTVRSGPSLHVYSRRQHARAHSLIWAFSACIFPKTACAGAQSDLGLLCMYIPKYTHMSHHKRFKGNWYTSEETTLSQLSCLPIEKGSQQIRQQISVHTDNFITHLHMIRNMQKGPLCNFQPKQALISLHIHLCHVWF